MKLNTISAHHIFKMDNQIQNYAWGSTTALKDLFDFTNPTLQPQAEVWMGTHPNGCSQVEHEQSYISLHDLIQHNPAAYLSANTSEQYGDLPFLFKILSAEKALSIQVHPNISDAQQGFVFENQLDIPLNAHHRNYKDRNHKPELVYALTHYQAMNGFRPYADIIANFHQANIAEIRDELMQFEQQPNAEGLRTFFTSLLTMNSEKQRYALDQLVSYATSTSDKELSQLIIELSQQYPNDNGLFGPLLLNVFTLKPGQAMFLNARTPHAYIKGTGLEIMANSDNVLRVGLTPKHIDIDELVKCTDFVPILEGDLLTPPLIDGCEQHYPVPVDDFKFSIFHAPQDHTVIVESAEIIMPIDDEAQIHAANGMSLTLKKGQSAFIPAYAGSYKITSFNRVARAYNS